MNKFNFGVRKSILTILSVFFITSVSYAQYDGYKYNPDGSYSVGGCYDGYKYNSDGSYSVGGAYDGYKVNPDGSYAVRWGPCRK